MSGFFPVIALAVFLASTQSSPILMGKAQYCDKIAPLRATLAPGMRFSPEQVTVSGCKNIWYRVPAWFAGTWHKQSQTITYRLTTATKNVDRSWHTVDVSGDERLGWQRDRAGDFWEYDCNYVQHSQSGANLTYHFVERCDLVSSHPERPIFEIQSLDIRVQKSTMQILTVERTISTETLTLLANDRMKVESVSKAFNANGAMVSEVHSTAVKERIADFSPVDQYQRRDMRALFRRYLMSIGRLDLIPNNVQASSAVDAP